MQKANVFKIFGGLIIAMLLLSCSKTELYHNLSEEDANEMLVVLHENNVKAKKVKEVVQNETTWTIQVSPEDVSKARGLLISHNLPHKKELGLGGVYKEKGFIPTPDEQRARFLLAQKGEIINSLRKIPEVVDADVILNIPIPKEYTDKETLTKPSASVIVKMRSSGKNDPGLTESQIQRFVANSIENLDPRNVSVIISYVGEGSRASSLPKSSLILPEVSGKSQSPQSQSDRDFVTIAGISVDAKMAGRLKLYLAIGLGILAILSIALIITVIRMSRLKQETGQGVVDGELEGPRDHDQLLPPE